MAVKKDSTNPRAKLTTAQASEGSPAFGQTASCKVGETAAAPRKTSKASIAVTLAILPATRMLRTVMSLATGIKLWTISFAEQVISASASCNCQKETGVCFQKTGQGRRMRRLALGSGAWRRQPRSPAGRRQRIRVERGVPPRNDAGSPRAFTIVPDAHGGALAPDKGPPGISGHWTQDRALFGERLLPGGVGRGAQLAVDFVLVDAAQELVEEAVGLGEFTAAVGGQERGEALLPEVLDRTPAQGFTERN